MHKKVWQRLISPESLSTIIIVLLGVGFYVAMLNLESLLSWLDIALSTISPFILAFVIAYLLNPLVKKIDSTLVKVMPNNDNFRDKLSIFIAYLAALALFSVLIALVIPEVVASFITLFNSLPTYIENLMGLLLTVEVNLSLPSGSLTSLVSEDSDFFEYLSGLIADIIPQLLDYSFQIGNSLITIIMAFIVSIYMLGGKERLLGQARKLLFAVLSVKNATEVMSLVSHSNKVFSGFIIGKALDSLIIGMICSIGMNIIGIPYVPLISVVIGVTNFIPFFGPFIGAIPCVFILLIVNPWDALWFGIFVLALQQFDGNILGPYILGDSTGLNAIWVLVAIVVGGGLFGVVGMVVGVPVFAVLYHLTSHAVAKALVRKGLDKNAYPLKKTEMQDD